MQDMAIYQITTANSVLTTASSDHAFESDTPVADTLIVEAGAYLKATGTHAFGAYLDRTLAWTVKVDGLIHSESGVALYVEYNNLQGSSVSASVGSAGVIYSGDTAVFNSANLTNDGMVYGVRYGIYAANALTINNSGTIYGGIEAIFGSSHADSVTNTGFLEGNVALGEGNDRLANSNVIFDDIDMGDGDDTITATAKGTFGGNISLGAGHDTVTNAGLMSATIFAGEGNDSITNKGTITYDVFLGNGLNSLTNSGSVHGSIFGGLERDVVKNTGTMDGVVDLGGGDDSFTGGSRTEILVDSAGSDTVKLGGGTDHYYGVWNFGSAADGLDVIDGGGGIDVYNAASAINSVFINLDRVAHDFSPFMPGSGAVTARTATGVGLTADKILNFEYAQGGAGSDIIYGSAGANVLVGNAGFDTIAGFGGNDVLHGGDDGDALWGGAGRDVLSGGAGADFFQFAKPSESGVGVSRRDVIADFESYIDLIDLRAIDANTRNGSAVNDAFTFMGGQSFTGIPGQLRVASSATVQIIEGDVNGDRKADFSIEVINTPTTLLLLEHDFLL
jgi:hypothetical protein